jgi:iron transport multicopper oxidase
MRVELFATIVLSATGATLASPFLSFPPVGKPVPPPAQKHSQSKTPSKRIPLVVSQFDSAPDGFATQAIGFNGQLFSPIIVKRGEPLELAVENRLENDETGIHIHGLFQNGTNYYDGVPGITQCPIGVNRTFSQFISTERQHGTYWYHSHHKAQYAKGLRSPFIILDPENEPYTKEYDDEYIVMFNEWYHARTPSDLLDPCKSQWSK